MDQEAGSPPATNPEEPTVASVLGVKGQLRFHPHGSTQKAHVVLRQVELSEESDDEGDSSVVYFSLFAQKRIEVKPGKEILLAVASPDGKLLEAPVVFAGKVSGEDEPEPSTCLQPNRIEPSSKAKSPILPPKLRKPWQETRIAEAVTHHGQLQRTYASVEIQTEPIRIPDEPVHPLTAATATIPKATSVQTEQSQAISAATTFTSTARAERRDSPPQRARSLSPMELDSRSSTPASSPPPVPEAEAQSTSRFKSTSFSPPGLSITMPPERDLPHVKASSATERRAPHTPPQMSPDSDSPPGLSLPPLSGQPTTWATGLLITSPSVASSREHIEQSPSTTTTLVSSPPVSADKTGTVLKAGPGSIEIVQRSESPAAPYVPKRKTVPNPFVRGGVLTDFVGSAPPGKKSVSQDTSSAHSPPLPTPTRMEPIPIPIDSIPPPPTAPVPPVPPPPKAPTERPATPPPPPGPAPSPPRSPQHGWSELSPPSSPASSSKVKMEDVPSLSSVTQTSPGISLAQFVNRLGPPPPRPSRFGGPLVPQTPYPPPLPDLRKFQSGGGPGESQEPAPDYRSLAFVGEGSFSNPLNIKPSGANKWKANGPLPPQLSTAAPGKANGPKKPLNIGNGWPHSRGGGGGGRGRRQNGGFAPGPNGQGMYPAGPGQMNGAPFDQGWGAYGPGNGMPTEGQSGRGPRRLRVRARFSSEEMNGMHDSGDYVASSPISSSNPGDSPTSARSPPGIFASTETPQDDVGSPGRGVKRAASPTPDTPAAMRTKTFNWPISNALHSVKLKGDDDVGVRSITYSSDGNLFAVGSNDKSVRIWNNKTRTEIAKLAHNMQIASVAWMDRDSGVVTLGENGIVSTWTRSAANKWQWAKILNAGGKGDDMPCCLAFHRDRMAIGYPRSGIKVWLFTKGTWTPQRSIVRQNVTTIRFVEDGEALIGGTTDGVLWHCQVPNGTLRASAFLRSKVVTLDVDPRGMHALAAQAGSCYLVNITQEGHGNVEQAYSSKDADVQSSAAYDFGALFAARGAALLFGSMHGCVMVWDRASGAIVHGLNHGEDHSIQAIASFDGNVAFEGYVLTGTRQGQLAWFAQPAVDGSGNRNGAQ
ncbi:WD40-repeat-containing domain protein [Phanerochaete sordida]|uniref:WD40-repeat-containing domain protein n=1 Tax=Phanerochaete sordida TaxID=48140 RepID=A0A9P3LBG5_9APHY|nr:WD40-repeat-containing domain protein [Phanerochaete sordida]